MSLVRPVAARYGRQCSDPGLLAAAALAHGPRASTGATAPPIDQDLLALLTGAVAAFGEPAPATAATLGRLHARLAVELAGDPDAAAGHAALAGSASRLSADPRAVAEGLPGRRRGHPAGI